MAKRDRADAVAAEGQTTPDLDLEHVRGQEGAKRALEIAAAGGHPILIAGPQSSGKTMLARALPGILPAPSEEERAEIAEIHRRAKLEPPAGAPVRAPHFSTRPTALGGRRRPGEVELARGGVLVLDDLPAFGKRSLRVIRQEVEDQRYPRPHTPGCDCDSCDTRARTFVVATMRSCPCGHSNDRPRVCSCAPWEKRRYWAPIEELFLDLVHVHVEVPGLYLSELRAGPGERSADVAERVTEARDRQLQRPGQNTFNACPAGDEGGGRDGRRRAVTPVEAQVALRAVADQLLAAEDRLRAEWEAVPRSVDEDAMFEGKRAWDLATEVRTVVECVGEDLRRVVGSLERVFRMTEKNLGRESRE